MENEIVKNKIADILNSEKGFILPYLAEKEVRIIEFNKKHFNLKESSSKIRESFMTLSKSLNLECTIPQSETNGLGNVYISKSSIKKFVNVKAVSLSCDPQTHFSILFYLKELIKSALLVEIHSDYNKDEEYGIRKVENGYGKDLIILRAYGALKNIETEEIFRAKITLKQNLTVHEQTNNMYSYEVVNIEMIESSSKNKEIELRHPIANSSNLAKNQTTHLISSNSISLAKLLLDVKKSYDEEKNILDASKESEKLLIEPENNILKEYLRQNNFLDRETQEKIVKNKGTHITTNVDTRLDSEIETIKDKLESLHEDQEESNTKSVRRKR